MEGVFQKKDASMEIVDVPSLKLRLSTLAKEKDFLQKESDMLKNRMQDLTAQVNKMEKRLHQATDKNRNLEKEKKQIGDSLHQLTSRCYQAEKIASYLERQCKEISPNQRVDYMAIDQAVAVDGKRLEPSIQLLAALSAAVIPCMNGCGSPCSHVIQETDASGFNVDVKLAEARMLPPVNSGKK